MILFVHLKFVINITLQVNCNVRNAEDRSVDMHQAMFHSVSRLQHTPASQLSLQRRQTTISTSSLAVKLSSSSVETTTVYTTEPDNIHSLLIKSCLSVKCHFLEIFLKLNQILHFIVSGMQLRIV